MRLSLTLDQGKNLLHHQLQLYRTTVYSLIIILQLQLYYANDELRLLLNYNLHVDFVLPVDYFNCGGLIIQQLGGTVSYLMQV